MVKTFIFHRADPEKSLSRRSQRGRDTAPRPLPSVILPTQGIALEITPSIENEDTTRSPEDARLPPPPEEDTTERTGEGEESPLLPRPPQLLETTERNSETTMTRVIPIFPVRIETKFQVRSFGTDSSGHIGQTLPSARALPPARLRTKKR